MSERRHRLRLIEALLFAAAEPVSEQALAERLGAADDVGELLRELATDYAGRGVNLMRLGGGWAFRTAPDLASELRAARHVARPLSRAAIETLAVIAYHQPMTRAEIEEIRGVGLGKGVLDTLLEAGWVCPKGRRESPGRPLLWITTDAFLAHFGLEKLADLPAIDELRAAGLLDLSPPAARDNISTAVDGSLVMGCEEVRYFRHETSQGFPPRGGRNRKHHGRAASAHAGRIRKEEYMSGITAMAPSKCTIELAAISGNSTRVRGHALRIQIHREE